MTILRIDNVLHGTGVTRDDDTPPKEASPLVEWNGALWVCSGEAEAERDTPANLTIPESSICFSSESIGSRSDHLVVTVLHHEDGAIEFYEIDRP